MTVPNDRISFTSRLHFLTDVTALEFLCSPEAVARLKGAVESLNAENQQHFLRGYRLAIATPLYGILQFAINFPELLGLEHDDILFNWLHYQNPERGESLMHAVSDPTSGLGRLCYALDALQAALRRADGRLANTVAAMEKCRATVKALSGVPSGARIVSLDTGEDVPDKESLLRLSVAERVLDYVEYDRSIVPLAYRMVWRSRKEVRPIGDRFISDAETHLDDVSLFPLAASVPEEWQYGLRFGFNIVVSLNNIDLPVHSDPISLVSQNWFNQLRAFVNPSYPQTEWPSMKYGLSEFSRPKVRRLLKHFEANMDTISSKDRLDAILGSDRVRLITDAGATDSIELEAVLRGTVAMHGDSKVHLLLLTHTVASDEGEWVSVALRLPMYGMFSNASKWFLFYKMYHTGYVYDTDVARSITAVERLLLEFKDNLKVEKIDGLDSEDFLPLCTLPAFRVMREVSQRSVEANATLRARSSELLAALWLVNQNYQYVKVAFAHASLGNHEYDAIGVKNGQCLVLEVKGATITDEKLQEQVNTFADKLADLRDQLPALTHALGYESDIKGISGLFVFLGDLGKFRPTDASIPLWSYDDFVKALRDAGIANKAIQLLDKHYVMRHVRLNDYPHDPFFVGLESDDS